MAQSIKNPTQQNFVQKTLGSTLNAGASVITLNNVTSIQNLPGVAIIDRINTNNVETPTQREVITFTGTSGVTLVGVIKNADGSGTDQSHAVGAIVEFGPDVIWAQSITDGLGQIIVPSTGLLDTTKIIPPTGGTLTSPNIVVGSDAAGDLYYRNAGASLARLAIGALGQHLSMNASLPAWQNPFPVHQAPQTLADAAIMYLDFSVGNKFFATIVPSAARTFLATNATTGDVAILRINYASTASLALGLLNSAASISLVRWPGGTLPTPTATQGKVDVFGFMANASTSAFDAFVVGQNL